MFPDNILWVYNARNGLMYLEKQQTPHIGYFLSSHADHYFAAEAMPLAAIVHLLQGGIVAVIDASRRKLFPDSLITGVGSWTYAFNRAIRVYEKSFVPHGTDAMWRYALYSKEAKRVKKIVRRLSSVFGNRGAASAFLYHKNQDTWRYNGRKVSLEFPTTVPAVISVSLENATWDDKPEIIAKRITRIEAR